MPKFQFSLYSFNYGTCTLNWYKIFLIVCNLTPVKLNYQPLSWSPFSFWSLVLNLCILTLNWTTNFFIWSIWPLIWSISTPIFMCLFQFDHWFWISSIKSLIVHQTSIFMQLDPWFDQINSYKNTIWSPYFNFF